jgi:Rieske Fe-S protein
MSDRPESSEKDAVASTPEEKGPSRRTFLSATSAVAMTGGLAAGYGTFAAMAGRFLYPARSGSASWQFVASVADFADGASLDFRTPDGERVAIARRGTSGTVDDFVALSSTCPHLGCQVHWEPQNNRFFCPCHNGAFDPSGQATAGPPFEANQSLPRFPLRIEAGLLYISVPTDRVTSPTRPGTALSGEGPEGPGHDPCLFQRFGGGASGEPA